MLNYRIVQEEGFGASGLWYAEQRTSFGWERVPHIMEGTAQEADAKLKGVCVSAASAVDEAIGGFNIEAARVTKEEFAFVLDEAKKLPIGWDGTERRKAYKAMRMEDACE